MASEKDKHLFEDAEFSSGAPTPLKSQSLEDVNAVPYDELSEAEKKAERRFLWKLDIIFTFVGFLGYIFKYLDQVNIANAYVSGMKEEINIVGNQYNYFTTLFNVGYVLVIYPSCIAVSHFGPHYWLPSAELIWGVLTCVLSLAQNYKHVYALRFFIGFAEGTAWPGYITVMSQWYMPKEVALRMGFFTVAQSLGSMFAGVMQGALSTTMDGTLGRSGWRWGFIVNGVCTIFVALLAYFSIPGFPDRPNPLAKWYLSDKDYAIARRRTARVKREPLKPINAKSFLKAFKYWQLWAIAFTWAFGYNIAPSNYFNLWLKSLTLDDGSKRYSVAELNYLPVIGFSLQLVATIVLCGLSDWLGVRLPSLLIHAAINITSEVILTIRPADRITHMVGWYLNYMGNVSYVLLAAWATTYLAHAPDVRTITIATGTIMAYLNNGFITLWTYPTNQAPDWKVGAKFYLVCMVVCTFGFVAIAWGLRFEERRRLRREGQVVPKPHPLAFLWT
ncbi:hypothetical protein CspeluHIS016_0211840 [Cutaneotrichosporon spelunceum]|uniref:Major facilitator superfamily (MFS) profile domain-containing protein n=1 Tax=Cutaneotrichosporon spelunceum TaxID=1672016 RepID=A0AAD3TSJ9_9TREE|nr:hypothetical protein CspeluHIS016_0211840 [Cutaneotrichosporon spelunceum]